MKVRNVLLAVALGVLVLAQSAPVAAQAEASRFEQAEGPDDTCDLHLIAGGPYEVSIAGAPAVIYENGSVVPVPQGSNVNYLRVERTIGFTAIGTTERCAVFVDDTGSDDAGADVSGSDEESSVAETPGETDPTTELPPELAVTGAEASLVAIVGALLVVAGLTFVVFDRRRLD